MATELVKSERTISLLRKGAKRLNDGGGLYLLPFAGGDTHYWRMDYVFQGRRKTLSLGSHPQVTLEMARQRAQEARDVLTAGLDPSSERRQTREAHVQAAQSKRRALSGQPAEGSFECVARRCMHSDFRHQLVKCLLVGNFSLSAKRSTQAPTRN